MVTARTANYRWLRATGWSIALPIAAIAGLVMGLIFSSSQTGVVAGAIASVFGLLILSLGYSLGNIWGGYWMIPLGLLGFNASLVVYIFEGRWLMVQVGTAAAIVLIALAAAISRTGEGEGGILQVIGHFFRSLIPGQYSDRSR